MRLLRLISPLLLLVLLTAGCKQDTSAPLLDFISNGTALTADRTATAADTFEVRVFAEARDKGPGLRRLTVTTQERFYRNPVQPKFQDSLPLVYFDTVFTQPTPPRNFLLINRFGAGTNAGRQEWKYTVTDVDGNKATRGYRITVQPADSVNPLHTYSVRLQAPRRSGSRAILAAERGFVLPAYAAYNPGPDLQLSYLRWADLVYVPTATGPVLAAPSASAALSSSVLRVNSWPLRRATELGASTVTSGEFNAINTASALSTAVAASTLRAGAAVPVGKDKAVAFRTADGNEGLLYITDVGTTAPVDLIMTIKIRR
ncbi:hypothetical protein LJ737_01760 [Hymenobacter sp. 15J16-1T3B]|uniref:hypothetical protein n=1 Tax=Hymenobacter sp. 15J16-1T3B TaxID=2886941 RepID=UPI001D122B2C|nr:hypothetical protein [Hymenobacter sp. 15J16-1T3B]MCC3155945.1 hypothetical protein [Hymenobacter sp. 15J16-1T3B]